MFKVYVAHPYDGKEENKLSVEKVILELMPRTPRVLYISPIHALGYLYEALSCDGMERCIALLRDCDMILLCEGWEDSKECKAAYTYALGMNIPIIYYNEDEHPLSFINKRK
jgi:hypothetical protein